MLSYFRFHPILYWLGGLAVMAGAGYAYFIEELENSKRSEALAGSPPEAVALAEFDQTAHSNVAGEVILIGELGVDSVYSLSQTKNGRETGRQWAAPLRVADATDPAQVHAVVYKEEIEVSSEMIESWMSESGVNGPVVRLHGVLVKPDFGIRKQVSEAFASEGVTLAKDAIYLDPFVGSRAEGLAPQSSNLPRNVGVVGAAIFLFGFVRAVFRRRAKVQAQAETQAQTQA